MKTPPKEKIKAKDNETKSSENNYFQFENVQKLIKMVNSNLNLAALSIGLAFSVLVFIVLTFLFTGLLGFAIKSIGIYTFAILILICSCLGGSIVTGFIGCHNNKEAVINGSFLSLIMLILMGLMVGVLLIIVLGALSALISSLGTSSAAATSSTSEQIVSLL